MSKKDLESKQEQKIDTKVTLKPKKETQKKVKKTSEIKTLSQALDPIAVSKLETPITVDDNGLNVTVLDNKTLKQFKKSNNKPRPKDKYTYEKNQEGYIVEVSDLRKTYLSGNVATEVLKGISFKIKRGEIAILYGKSGSGKSTLLNIISALDRPTSGKVIVNDISLPYLSNRNQTLFRRENISFIFQNYNLLQNLNSYDNVETGSYLQSDKSKRLDIKKLFVDFDLEQCMYKYPSQMSGGQQQRVSILRAIAKNSEIIVVKLLQQINKEYKSTIIIVSHDPDIAAIADKVIYLELGHVKNIVEQERK